jgi:hypothetical protein
MPLDELMWPSRPTPILGMPQPAATCSATWAFINLPDPKAFHPNAAGYRAYADAIKTKLQGGWLDKQKLLVSRPTT